MAMMILMPFLRVARAGNSTKNAGEVRHLLTLLAFFSSQGFGLARLRAGMGLPSVARAGGEAYFSVCVEQGDTSGFCAGFSLSV